MCSPFILLLLLYFLLHPFSSFLPLFQHTRPKRVSELDLHNRVFATANSLMDVVLDYFFRRRKDVLDLLDLSSSSFLFSSCHAADAIFIYHLHWFKTKLNVFFFYFIIFLLGCCWIVQFWFSYAGQSGAPGGGRVRCAQSAPPAVHGFERQVGLGHGNQERLPQGQDWNPRLLSQGNNNNNSAEPKLHLELHVQNR